MRDRGIDYEANRTDPYLEDLTATNLFGPAARWALFCLVVLILVVGAALSYVLPATTEIVP